MLYTIVIIYVNKFEHKYLLRLLGLFSAAALVDLCTSDDPETLRLALQTLELIALESTDVIFYQVCVYTVHA